MCSGQQNTGLLDEFITGCIHNHKHDTSHDWNMRETGKKPVIFMSGMSVSQVGVQVDSAGLVHTSLSYLFGASGWKILRQDISDYNLC